MITIIIASANARMLEQIKRNIAETVGVPYEILAFENANGEKGICQIYNEGIDKAQYDVLCFMHEDIALKTTGWGALAKKIFDRNEDIGIIGIAGSTYKSIMPNGWGSPGAYGTERTNLIQSFKYIKADSIRTYVNPEDKCWVRAVAVDGAWMCVRRDVVNNFRFDSDNFKGFHCYDVDYCLSVGKRYNIVVSYEVLIHHFSEGRFDRDWMEQSLLLFKKWEDELPRSTEAVSAKQIHTIEKRNFRETIKQLYKLGFEASVAYRILQRPRVRKILGPKYSLKFHYLIFSTYRGLKKKDD